MSWEAEIKGIYIVEDELYTDHNRAIVFPDSLISTSDDLKESFMSARQHTGLWSKIVEATHEDLRSELENFLIDDNDSANYSNLDGWYTSTGRAIWEDKWRLPYYKDEYFFLNDIEQNTVPVKLFSNYTEAIKYLLENCSCDANCDLNVWLLDRELDDANHDRDILELLELLSLRDDSIGVIYSARSEGLASRNDIYEFVKNVIESNKHSFEDGLKTMFEAQYPNMLFLQSPGFINEINSSIDQLYDMKICLNNLVWLMEKNDIEVFEKLKDVIQEAKHGFEVFKLIKIHTSERNKALSIGLLRTTQLELKDIEYLKAKSITEGTNISDTLVRVHDGYTKQEFSNLLTQNESYFKVIKRIEAWESSLNNPVPENDFHKVVDSYERFDYSINKLFKPLMTGDIFEILHPTRDGKSSREYYMLLTQECDCVVRSQSDKKIKRRVGVATVVEISLKTNPTADISGKLAEMSALIDGGDLNNEEATGHLLECVESIRQQAATATDGSIRILPMGLFNYEQTSKHFLIHLRKTMHIDFEILDLCTINKDGGSYLEISNIQTLKQNIIPLYPKLYQEHLTKLVEKVERLNSSENTLISEHIEDRNLNTYIGKEGKIYYRIKRLARLNMPYQAFVQAYYGLTQSNIGLPMKI